MMLNLRDRPIEQKLVLTTMVTTIAALLLAGVGVIVAESILFRSYLRRDLSALAQIIADNSTGALSFNDPDVANETLGALRARAHLVGACIDQANGRTLATYARDGEFRCPEPGYDKRIQITLAEVTLSQPVVLNGRRIGALVLVYDLGELYERIRLYAVIVFGLLAASSVFAFFLSRRLRRVISDPISHLVRATRSVSETGDYTVRAQKLSGDELGVLVDRFNEMLAGIESRENQLKKVLLDREAAFREIAEEQERFRFMAESMPQKIFTAAPSGELTYMNRQWMDFTGLTFEQIRDGRWANFVHPDDVGTGLQTWQEALESGEPLTITNRHRRADGAYRWHLNRARAMRNDKGEITLWIGSSTDIHEQKEREEELRQANEDLQQFAYSASHDLQEPIRNVSIYSEIVAQRYDRVLDADGKQFLEFLREGGRRLGTLVDDLLAYTRASMAEISATPANSEQVFKNTLASLAEAIRESDARISSDALPEIPMGEAHLQQVLQNLISNSLKYRDHRQPDIHVSAAAAGSFWRFSVQDNGIGIDPQYKEKIFGVFKRLHKDKKYGGTGIGLAICQRVVERYGGTIWVESKPGIGSTFYFTVPQQGERSHATANQSASC